MHRFFVSPDLILTPGASVRLPGDLVHQVGRVLRGRVGDHIMLLDGSGDECEVELTSFAPGAIEGLVLARRTNLAEPALHLTLYQCVLKGDKMELVLQKATELGISAFVPVVSERVVAQGDAGSERSRRERWLRIVREAAEQSGRGRLPELRPQVRWSAALDQAAASGATLIVPWEQAASGAGITSIRAKAAASQPVALFIGPEGGLSEQEARQAAAASATLVSLGPRILRAETAAIAATALLLAGEQ
jgi:16S rRNA (uracil1498-N3)-methyltransferase